jgi:hypothetical protein
VTFEKAFSPGTKVRIRIVYRGASFHAQGKVIYARPESGIGIAFTGIERENQQVLEEWISEIRNQK